MYPYKYIYIYICIPIFPYIYTNTSIPSAVSTPKCQVDLVVSIPKLSSGLVEVKITLLHLPIRIHRGISRVMYGSPLGCIGVHRNVPPRMENTTEKPMKTEMKASTSSLKYWFPFVFM